MLCVHRARLCATLLTLLLLAPSALAAGIPKHLSHQGVLTDTAGVVVPDGLYTLDFDIFDAASSGNHLFGQQLQVEVVGGVYNVLLSDNASSPGTLEQAFQNPTTYLQITISDVPPGSGITAPQPLAPRQKLASVPYAFVAGSAEASSRVLLDQHEASGDAEVVFSLPLEFDRFEIDLVDVFPSSTSPVDFAVHVSRDGGTTWDEGASDYAWTIVYGTNTNLYQAGEQTGSKINLNMEHDNSRLRNAPGNSFNAEVVVQNPGGGNGYFALRVSATNFRTETDDKASVTTLSGFRLDPTLSRVDGLRFRMSAGNIQGGKFKLYGLR
jgi:hypothetical protein